MAGLWDLLVPSAATNYIKNPSFENTVLTSWSNSDTGAGSKAEAFSSTYAVDGIRSFYVTLTGTLETTYYQDISGLTAGLTYTLTAYVKSDAINTTDIDLIAYDGGGTSNPVTDSYTSSTNDWERLTVSKTCPVGGSIRFALVSNNAATYYDACQLELGTSASTYFDGDTPNCSWGGARYTSISTRPATARNGGIWTDLQDLSAYVTSVLGLGIGDNELNISEFALRDGGEVRQVRIPSRNFTLGFTVTAASQAALHSARQTLENYFRASRYGGIEPCYLRYRGASANVVIKAIYEGGMSYVQVGQDGFAENVAARFVLQDGMLGTETQGIDDLSYTAPIFETYSNIAQYNGNTWSVPGTGFNATVAALTEAYDGTIYAGGGFDTSGGGEAFTYVAKYDGDTWTALDGGTDGFVHEVQLAPDGTLYIGGEFTNAGSTPLAVNYIAKFDGDTWSALDGGTNNFVYALAVDTSGNVYAGGTFTEVGSTPITTSAIAKFDGDTWSAVPASSTGADNYINVIKIDANGLVYAGGAFDNIGGVAAAKVAVFDGTTWAAMGSGFNAQVNALLATPDGYIYAGGAFTDTGGGELINSVARWNGTAWEALTTDTLSQVYSLAYRDGIVFIGAEGIVNGTPFVEWNGSNYFVTTINVPGGGQTVNAILPTRQGNRLWIGGTLNDTSSTQAASNTTTIIGSGDSQPKITVIGSGATTLYWLENQTTGQRIMFDMGILNGERVELDCKTASVTSSFGRNLLPGILNGSDFSTFKLVPGANTISCFAVTTGTPKIVLTWEDKAIGL